jgi:hypothetical protein
MPKQHFSQLNSKVRNITNFRIELRTHPYSQRFLTILIKNVAKHFLFDNFIKKMLRNIFLFDNLIKKTFSQCFLTVLIKKNVAKTFYLIF